MVHMVHYHPRNDKIMLILYPEHIEAETKWPPFADDIFKCIFLNENVSVAITISLKFVPKGPISNIPALVQIMAWRRPGDKPLSGPMMVSLSTHICVTRPQWVKRMSSYNLGPYLLLSSTWTHHFMIRKFWPHFGLNHDGFIVVAHQCTEIHRMG